MTQLLKGLPILTNLLVTATLGGKCYYYSHFTDEEEGLREIKSLFKIAQLVNCIA